VSSDADTPAVKEVTVRDFYPAPQIDDAAFGVDLYLDGELAGHASNDGRGGCHRYEFHTRQQREAFFAYARAWASEHDKRTSEPADALVNWLCDEFEYAEGARDLVSKGATTVLLIEKGPRWLNDDHDRDPDIYESTHLVGIRGGKDPQEVAAEQGAHKWRVIPTE
jgi:hypothetical protein